MNPAIPYVLGCVLTFFIVSRAYRSKANEETIVAPAVHTVGVIEAPSEVRIPIVEFILSRLQESPRFGPGSTESLKRDIIIRNMLWNHEPSMVDGRLRCPTCKPTLGVYRPCSDLKEAAKLFATHQQFKDEWLE